MLQSNILADMFKLVSNPEPTVIEGDFVHLKEIASIQEDLGNEEFLFFPRAIAVGKPGLLIYDVAQAKILHLDNQLKFINSWGRKGNGPGEFSGNKYSMFEMTFGKDGKIYANDPRAYRIQNFDISGKPLRTFRYSELWKTKRPLVDKEGNILHATIQNNKVKLFNQNNDCVIQFPVKDEYISYLLYLPDNIYRNSRINAGDYKIALRYTKNSRLIVYFEESATMAVISQEGKVKVLKLWPKNALIRYKKELSEIIESKPKASSSKGHKPSGSKPHKPMFRAPFVDLDKDGYFYLQLTAMFENGKIPVYIYKFDLNGNLINVFHIPIENQKSRTLHFIAKQNNRFYAISDWESIKTFQEEVQ
jgi:hypothetical protein